MEHAKILFKIQIGLHEIESKMSLLNIIIKDLHAYKSKYNQNGEYKQTSVGVIFSLLVPEFAVVARFRVYNHLNKSRFQLLKLFAKLIYVRTIKKYSCDIHPEASIGIPLKLGHAIDIVIGPGASIGQNCYIFNGVSIGNKYPGGENKMPSIGDNVIIGTGAKVLGGIKVDDRVKIGALTLVISDVTEGTVAVGVPYRKT